MISFNNVTAQVGNIPFDPLKILPKPKAQPEKSEKNKKIEIIHADFLEQKTDTTVNIVRRILRDHVKLLHEGAFMKCDSAILFPQRNYLEAHGNIKITKGDSIDIRSKHLYYDGNTKLAILKEQVELRDQSSILKAPKMTYEVNNDIGHFWNGGQLFVDSTVLTSNNGTYYQDKGYTIFRDQVILKSPDYTMFADSMKYETESKVVHFITETIIVSNNDTIFTNDGYFDTEKNVAILKGRPLIKNGEDNTLQSNHIDYNKANGTGIATGNAISRNTKENVTLLSNHIYYIDSIQYTRATQDPLLIRYEEKDTLYISADTLINYSMPLEEFLALHPNPSNEVDSFFVQLHLIALMLNNKNTSATIVQDTIFLQALEHTAAQNNISEQLSAHINITDIKKNGSDTLNWNDTKDNQNVQTDSSTVSLINMDTLNSDQQAKSDSVKIFYGYRNIKLIRSNMSGLCDSLYFNSRDSIFKLYYSPVLWIDSMQMESDSMYIFMKNEEAERIELYQNATIVNDNDPGIYNQISGKKITIWLKNNQLNLVLVDGNAESIYFLKNDSSQYIGGNRASGALIYITFKKDNEIKQIKLSNTPEAQFTPIQLIDFNSYKLPHFSWFWSYKPHTKWDVIRDDSQYNNYIAEHPHHIKDSIQQIEKDSIEIQLEENDTLKKSDIDKDALAPALPTPSNQTLDADLPNINQGILNNKRGVKKKRVE